MDRVDPHAEIPLPSGVYGTLWSLFSHKMLLQLLRILWILVNNLYCIPAYFAYLGLLSPLLLASPDTYWRLEEIFFNWMLSMVACWNYTAGYSVHESGDRLESVTGERFLYMPNHQSTADVPLCMTIFAARKGFCDKVMWIMDKVFKFTNFGWVAWMHDDFFILAGKANRDSSLVELRRHLTEVFIPKGRKYLVLFPEGGFLRKRKAVSQSFATKNNLPHLDYCTLPRTGALEVVLDILGPNAPSLAETAAAAANGGAAPMNGSLADSLVSRVSEEEVDNPRVTKIVDVTIAYPDGQPLDLISILTGSRGKCVTHVHYRIFDVKDLPSDPEPLRHWMYNLYAEKDTLLEEFYRTGRFPYTKFNPEGEPPLELQHDPLRFLRLHVFFIASTLVMWYLSAPLRAVLPAWGW